MNVAAFTGHRPSGFNFGYDEQNTLCQQIKDALLEATRSLYQEHDVRTFCTGCAQGTDSWASEAVISLRDLYFADMKLICVKPFQDFADKWTNDYRTRLGRILEAADEVITVCDAYSADAYKRRNFYMVDRSRYLVAVYDFEEHRHSGTLQTLNYAKRLGLNIVYINPQNAEVTFSFT